MIYSGIKPRLIAKPSAKASGGNIKMRRHPKMGPQAQYSYIRRGVKDAERQIIGRANRTRRGRAMQARRNHPMLIHIWMYHGYFLVNY